MLKIELLASNFQPRTSHFTLRTSNFELRTSRLAGRRPRQAVAEYTALKLSVLHRLKVASRVLFASKERAWHSDEAAWQAYERVRDAVAKMKVDAADGVARPSEYWNAELANIDYLADASPLVIRKLRHHAFWITGLRAYDYRVQDDAQRELFEMRLRALTQIGGADLLIAEPEVLGGFGYRIDGALYNLDTLKFL